MVAPFIIVVLVATSDAPTKATATMTTTVEAALGEGAALLVHAVETPLLDPEAERLQVVLHADALAEVTWTDALHAHVHLHLSKTDTWSDRDLSFSGTEPPDERGRTVGLALATMIPTPVPDETPVASGDSRDTTPAIASPLPRAGAHPEAMGAAHTSYGELDLLMIASHGLGGYAGGLGGELSVRARLGDAFRVRLAGGVRLGQIPPPGTATSVMRLAAGLAWRPWSTIETGSFDAGVRADVLLIRHAVERPTPDDRDVSRDARWLPGVEAIVEGSWAFAREASLVAGAGVEVAFGTTRVFNEGQLVATIPRARLVAELGLRAQF